MPGSRRPRYLTAAVRRDLELRYFRNIEGREVDFVLVEGRRPHQLAEIERGRGTAYDPVVADACLKLFREKGYAIPA